MQITSNYSVLGLKNVQNLKSKENAVTAPSFKAGEQTLAKVAAGTLAAAAGVIVNKMNTENEEPVITYDQHRERAQAMEKKLNDEDIADAYSFMLEDLSEITGKNFDGIINDFIEMHNEVENGHPITKEFVNTKMNEMKEKYNLDKNAESEVEYALLDQWKHVADYKMARGVKKGQISRSDMRKKAEPNEEVLQRFDDLFRRVGKPIKTGKYANGDENRTYLNKDRQEIDVHIRGNFSAEEYLNFEEPNGIKHSLKKEYYIHHKDFDEIAEKTNGSFCGFISDGMHGITETITNGNKVEETKYDSWGIPEYKKTTVTTEDKETKTNIYYAGDGSVLKETSSVEYFK